jgi:hypothetical protein
MKKEYGFTSLHGKGIRDERINFKLRLQGSEILSFDKDVKKCHLSR